MFIYTFVDTTGTTCDTYHPNNNGHIHITNRILEALPQAVKNAKLFENYDRTSNTGIINTVIFALKRFAAVIWKSLKIE